MAGLRQFWRFYRRSSGAKHEFVALCLGLAVGLAVLPLLIWLVGKATLGPYTNGGLLALWRDFFVALAQGSLAYWLVALGPYLALWVLRIARVSLHR
jgi:hypothetical protein